MDFKESYEYVVRRLVAALAMGEEAAAEPGRPDLTTEFCTVVDDLRADPEIYNLAISTKFLRDTYVAPLMVLHSKLLGDDEQDAADDDDENPSAVPESFITRHALPPPPTEISSDGMVSLMRSLHAWILAELFELFEGDVPESEKQLAQPGGRYVLESFSTLTALFGKLMLYATIGDRWRSLLQAGFHEWDSSEMRCARLRVIDTVRSVYHEFYCPEKEVTSRLVALIEAD